MSSPGTKSRYIVVLALGVVLGSVLVPPVTAHVNERFGHLWSDHIKPRLSAEGTVNSPGNPVSWSQLKDMPDGFVDGVDAGQDGGDGDKRTIVIPHFFETKGAVESDPNSTDVDVKAVYRRGITGGCSVSPPIFCPVGRVSLYLFDDSGKPLEGGDAATGAGTVVCNPCTRDLGMNARTTTFSLQDLITDAGGFDREVKLGYGVLVVDGQDPDVVSLFAFVTNSHTSPFDLTHSFPPLEEVPTDS